LNLHKEAHMKKLSRGGRVAVLDGRRILMLRNMATPPTLELKLERSSDFDNPPTRDQGTDAPGRTNDYSGRRSAMETPDYHQMAEDRFVAGIAGELANELADGTFKDLVIVAPASALAALRKALSPAVRAATVLEIDKDLTKHAPGDIAGIVARSLEEANRPR
jgi:protein required for attachment to host cells